MNRCAFLVFFQVISALFLSLAVERPCMAGRLFYQRIDLATTEQPRDVASGDLNGDGMADLVVAKLPTAVFLEGEGSVSILLNRGGDDFAEPVDYAAGSLPTSVAVEDLNGDGSPDLAVTDFGDLMGWGGPGKVMLFFNTSHGTFLPPVEYEAGFLPTSVTIGDLNGDHSPDLAVSNFGNVLDPGNPGSVSILLNNGDGSFQPSNNLEIEDGLARIVMANLDGDQNMDLAVANSLTDRVVVLRNMGGGGFDLPVGYDVEGAPSYLVAGDLDGEGSVDLASANFLSWDVSVLLNRGDGTFQGAGRFGVGEAPWSAGIEDFDGDGELDLVVANYADSDVWMLVGQGDGTFEPSVTYHTGNLPVAMAVNDFDGDRLFDFAVATVSQDPEDEESAGISLFLGYGRGHFRAVTYYVPEEAPSDVALKDLDRDGSLDLVVASSTNDSVSVFSNSGTGSLTLKDRYQAADVRGVRVEDFNGDRVFDLSVRRGSSVILLLGNGDGTFEPAGEYDLTSYTSDFAAADLNGDESPDLAFSSTSYTDRVSVLLNQGDGTFGVQADYEAGEYSYSIAAGDLDGDGPLDLVVAFRDALGVMPGNGDGTFRAPIRYERYGYRSIFLGDLDQDGSPDVVAANPGENLFSVYLNDGDGSLQGPRDYVTGDNPGRPIAFDLTGDGSLDLVFTEEGDRYEEDPGAVYVLLNKGDGTFLPADQYRAGDGPGPVSIGDLDGDGSAELVVANTRSSDFSVLFNKSASELIQLRPPDGFASAGPPELEWARGGYDLFFIYTVFPYTGSGYYSLVRKTYGTTYSISAELWKLLEPYTPCYWVVVGVNTNTNDLEVTGPWWMLKTVAGSGMVPIVGCNFEMGDSFDEGGPDELPVHVVWLPAFEMDVHEVTNREYAECVSAGSCSPPARTESETRASYYGNPEYDDYPVIYVTWWQADDYCEWAGKRLPSEAEWECSARGGVPGNRFPWGDELDGMYANYLHSGDPQDNDTTRVGSYPANGYGLVDMAGNVQEWVNDYYDREFYQHCMDQGLLVSPVGPAVGAGRVLRGGSWYGSSYDLRVAERVNSSPNVDSDWRGFRCAR